MGRVVLLGSSRGLTERVNFYADVHRRGLTILGAHMINRPAVDRSPGLHPAKDDHRTVLELMAARRIDVSHLVGAWLAPDAAPSAYRRLQEREAGVLTLGFDWGA